MIYSRITGTGAYLPEKIVSNRDLEKLFDTTDEWIRTRTGIERRHIAADGETTVDLAEHAARRALAAAGVAAEDVDFIAFGTTTPDLIFPNCGVLLQKRLGCIGVPAFSVETACAGFMYALSIADKYVRCGEAKRALVIGSETLSRITGVRVWLKTENLQRTGSFKIRGAVNKIAQLGEAERAAGVIAASAGNHGQAVAWAARELGIPSTVFMPQDAPMAKVEATRNYGADTVLVGAMFDDALAAATERAEQSGATFVHAFEDPQVIAGQGTIGLEMAEQAAAAGAEFDFVLAPCSGGGLSSGIALGVSGRSPNTRIITVQPEGYDGARLSLERGERIAADGMRSTIADALTSPAPGVLPFAILKSLRARGIAISDDELMRAVGYAALELKLVVEPGGSAALAALLAGRFALPGKTIGVVLSGGNIDAEMLKRCL